MDFQLPPRIQTDLGKTRRVGFEIEFGGISIAEVAGLIQHLFQGRIERKHQYSYRVLDTLYGDFTIESDSRLLSEKRYETYLEQMGVAQTSRLHESVEKIFEHLSGTLLPLEISMPPLPITDLQPAERIREELQRHSALGISSSIFAAYGMQINPEVPDFQVTTLLSYLRAFLMLSDWLLTDANIAIARKVTPFITPFPRAYQNLLLDTNYEPSMSRLMRDYLHFNPTRNRPLDLLPLFTFLDPELVFQYPVEKDLIKPRPTFHYRLPNSEIDDPHWSFAREWNKWVQVEILAEKQNHALKDRLDVRT
jgi:hypothetical protein